MPSWCGWSDFVSSVQTMGGPGLGDLELHSMFYLVGPLEITFKTKVSLQTVFRQRFVASADFLVVGNQYFPGK